MDIKGWNSDCRELSDEAVAAIWRLARYDVLAGQAGFRRMTKAIEKAKTKGR